MRAAEGRGKEEIEERKMSKKKKKMAKKKKTHPSLFFLFSFTARGPFFFAS